MFLHFNNPDVVHTEHRRREELAATWRRPRTARRATPRTTLGSLLDEAGGVLHGGALDGRDPRQAALIEALATALVSAASQHDPTLAVLAPRDGEPPVVAVRSLALLAQRGTASAIPVDARRAAVVRDLLRQLGAEPGRDRWHRRARTTPSRGATLAGSPPVATAASARADEGCTSLPA